MKPTRVEPGKPAQYRHQELEESEVVGEAEVLARGDGLERESGRDGDRERVHCQAERDGDEWQQIHARLLGAGARRKDSTRAKARRVKERGVPSGQGVPGPSGLTLRRQRGIFDN